MKYVILLSVTLFIFSCNSITPREDYAGIGEFSKKVLISIKEKKVSRFLSLVVRPEEFAELLESLPEDHNKNSMIKLSKREALNWWLDDLKVIPQKFYSVIEEGSKNNIDWNDIVYSKVKYKIERRNNIITADYIDIIFTYKKQSYAIRLDDCVKLKRGWLMVDKITWKGDVK